MPLDAAGQIQALSGFNFKAAKLTDNKDKKLYAAVSKINDQGHKQQKVKP